MKRMVVWLILVLGIFLAVGYLPVESAGQVKINEIMWAGAEYIELYNGGDDEVSLAGWQLKRQKPDAEIELITILADGATIGSHAFYLLQMSDATTESADASLPSNKLVDGGVLLTLVDESGATVDTANRQGAWFAGKNVDGGFSMERVSPSAPGEEQASWRTSTGSGGGRHGTPRVGNSEEEVVTPTPEPVYPDTIRINEFLPNPTGTDTDAEFVELFNTGAEVVDLSGWKLDDIEGGSSPYIFPEGTVLTAGQIAAYTQAVTNITLNNDADEVRLISPDGAVKSQAIYTGSPAEGQSYNFTAAGYVLSTTLTPNAANVVTQPVATATPSPEPDTVYPTAMRVNEWLPDPEGSDSELEFIELMNTGQVEVDIGGWKVDDAEGSSSPYSIPAGTRVAAGGFISFTSAVTNISLSNSGDTVRLLDPNGAVQSTFTYASSHEGVSWNRLDDGQAESTTLTPGAANIITALPEASSSSSSSTTTSRSARATATPRPGQVAGAQARVVPLKNVRSQPLGSFITTEGVVSVPPGVLGKTIMYLAGSGMQVYSGKGFPAVQAGDYVRVTGTLRSAAGELRVGMSAITDMVKLKEGDEPMPYEVATGKVGEMWEGSLVEVSGGVTESDGASFVIDDGSGPVRVTIRATTGITKPRLVRGTEVTIIGVVAQTSGGYRILPRWQDDVTFGSRPAPARRASAARARVPRIASGVVTVSPEAVTPVAVPSPPVVARRGWHMTPEMVFVSCMAAMVLLVMGFRANEPLLALTTSRV